MAKKSPKDLVREGDSGEPTEIAKERLYEECEEALEELLKSRMDEWTRAI